MQGEQPAAKGYPAAIDVRVKGGIRRVRLTGSGPGGHAMTSAQYGALPGEVGNDLQPAAQRLDVAGQGADLGCAGLGALDG